MNVSCGLLLFHLLMEKMGREGRGKGQSRNRHRYDMQKYSKMMQMKQLSLAGIALCPAMESSQPGIAASHHKQDPRQEDKELGLGSCGQHGAGSAQAGQQLAPRDLKALMCSTSGVLGCHGEFIGSCVNCLCSALRQKEHEKDVNAADNELEL